jgi:hypothetical protein
MRQLFTKFRVWSQFRDWHREVSKYNKGRKNM